MWDGYYFIYCNTHCNSLTLTLSLVACQRGSVRLSYSTVPLQGTLEICSNETWHTLCDRCWDNNDAAVVCHQLGYSRIGTQTKINTWLLPLILTIRPQFINFSSSLYRHFPCTQCTTWYYHCSPDPPAILLVNFFLEKYLPLPAMDKYSLCATVEGFFQKTKVTARQLTDMLVCNVFAVHSLSLVHIM